MRWAAIGAIALAAFTLGTLGFIQRFALAGEHFTLLDALYLSLQLFTLESGAVTAPVPAALQVARFLAPATGVLVAVMGAAALLGERLARFRLRFAKGHVVVCGLGERGMRVVEDVTERGMRVAVVEHDGDEPHIAQARAAGAVVVVGDATVARTLDAVRAASARHVIAVCTDDGVNAEIAVTLAALVRQQRPGLPVTVVVHVEDTELSGLLAERGPLAAGDDALEVVYFNAHRSGAAAMLAAVPPVSEDLERPPWIVVVGAGKLGRSLIVEAARIWQVAPGWPVDRPKVTLIDRVALAKAELLHVRVPRLAESCDLVPVQLEQNSPEFQRGDPLRDETGASPDVVYICPDDDVHALAAALVVQRHTTETLIAVRMSRETGLASLLRGCDDEGVRGIRAVGVLDATCTLDAMLSAAHRS